MRIAMLFGFALTLLGCTEETADWYGDERFSDDERTQIETGSAWLAEQAGLPAPVIRWGYDFAGSEPMRNQIRREVGPDGQGECVGGIGGTVYLGVDGDARVNAPPMRRELVPGFAAHELAHCTLGFVDGYRAGDVQSDGIMRVLYPMKWSDAEHAQCASSTVCRH